MTKKNIFPVVATIAVVGIVLGVFSMTVMRDSNVSISTMTSEQAYANLSSKMKRIGVQEVKVNPQQLDVSEFLDAKMNCPTLNPPTHSWWRGTVISTLKSSLPARKQQNPAPILS